jgi:hypothetical protein
MEHLERNWRIKEMEVDSDFAVCYASLAKWANAKAWQIDTTVFVCMIMYTIFAILKSQTHSV